MPGPKSPYGYDETFHSLLARIQTERPEQVRIRTSQHPVRMRALFNQFRTSWEREADSLRRKKDFDAANLALDKYTALIRYSCTLLSDGILLTHKGTVLDSIETFGRVIEKTDITSDETKPTDWAEIQRGQDKAIRDILGLKPEQVIKDNPPGEPDEKL